MNLAYFRKSTVSKDETIKNLKSQAKKDGWSVLGETELPKNGTMVHVCRPELMDKLVTTDRNLVGLMPCSVVVMADGTDVYVGTGDPAVLGGVSQQPEVKEIAAELEDRVRALINAAAKVGDLKPTGVKLYSTMSCPYCKMEKSWLEEKKVKHDVVYVDLNQEEAQKMVQKTGQMGVPVTEVMYEGADSEYIIGFDKPQLSKLLGVV